MYDNPEALKNPNNLQQPINGAPVVEINPSQLDPMTAAIMYGYQRPEQAATELLVRAEVGAMNQANQNGETDSISASVAADEARHDKDVDNARHIVEAALGVEAVARVEQVAVKTALVRSDAAPSQEVNQIAYAIANNASPVEQLNKRISGEAGTTELAALTDKIDGRALPTVDRVTNSIKHEVKDFGFTDADTKTLTGDALASGKQEITKTDVASNVEDELFGKLAIKEIAGRKKMTTQMKNTIRTLGSKPGQLLAVSRAVSQYRRSGSVSKGTLRQAGKNLRKFGK